MIPISREVRVCVPQDLVEWLEDDRKLDVPSFCQKVLIQLLYQTMNNFKAEQLKGTEGDDNGRTGIVDIGNKQETVK